MTAAILLAAGESTRMGRPKALLPWGDATLIEYQVRQLTEAGVDDIVVVLGHEAAAVRSHVPAPARVVINEAYREGRASSLRTGAAALPEGAGPIIVLSVDQPRPAALISKLLEAHRERGAAVTLPVGDGKRGHPVIMAGALLPELRAASEDQQGLRGILAAHEDGIREVHFMLMTHESMLDAPDYTALMVTTDLNTPEQYRDALTLFRATPPAP